MLKKIGIAAIGVAFAGTATAQSMPTGFYVDGNVEYAYFSRAPNDLNTSKIDLTFGYDGSQAGSVPIGAELNVYYLDIYGNSPDPHVSGIVYYDSSYGRFSIGMPSTVVDDYIDAPVIGRADAFNFGSSGNIGDTYVGLVSEITETDVYGVRYDGNYNNVKYGLSYHVFENGGDQYGITGAVQYQINDNITAAAGFETFNSDTSNTGYYGLIEADYGRLGGKLLVAEGIIISETAILIEASYDLIDDLEVYAGYATSSGGLDVDIAYVGLEYTFLDYGYVGASYIDGSPGGDNTNIKVGYNFMFGRR